VNFFSSFQTVIFSKLTPKRTISAILYTEANLACKIVGTKVTLNLQANSTKTAQTHNSLKRKMQTNLTKSLDHGMFEQ
jgi:hypothetical protein